MTLTRIELLDVYISLRCQVQLFLLVEFAKNDVHFLFTYLFWCFNFFEYNCVPLLTVRQKNARILPPMMGKKGGKGKNAKMMMPNGLSQEITQPYSQSMSQVCVLHSLVVILSSYTLFLIDISRVIFRICRSPDSVYRSPAYLNRNYRRTVTWSANFILRRMVSFRKIHPIRSTRLLHFIRPNRTRTSRR